MIWYDMIWYDMIWYDMIWYDMIWYDMILCYSCKIKISSTFYFFQMINLKERVNSVGEPYYVFFVIRGSVQVYRELHLLKYVDKFGNSTIGLDKCKLSSRCLQKGMVKVFLPTVKFHLSSCNWYQCNFPSFSIYLKNYYWLCNVDTSSIYCKMGLGFSFGDCVRWSLVARER